MDLGNFSVSLAVKDIAVSRAFYEKLGFEAINGQHNYNDQFKMEPGQDWLSLRNGDARIGLFQGMFDDNILTFNPGDVREIQTELLSEGVAITLEAAGVEGPAHIMLSDPDGNQIMLDQF
jgi:catechol 2,3-dioxygenase-like lactoylglutathione lyase family enzyme